MEIKKMFYYFKIEVLRFLREPISLFFTLIFPIILIYIFGDSFGETNNSSTQHTYYNSLVAIDTAFLIANFTLMGIGNDLASQKETGVYENLKLLPLSGWTRVIIESIAYLFLLFLSVILIILFVYFKYPNIHFRGNVFLFISFILLSYFTFVSIVRAIVSLNYSARTLQLVASSVFFVLLFVSGIVIPKESLPDLIKGFVDVSPTYIIYKVLDSIWNNNLKGSYFIICSIYFTLLIIVFNLFVIFKRNLTR
ncbi:ABC transporter permease [Staphylococcus hominis]|uniref:ABC transporter permease n=1 Tax=Staphylococcus hominis TaxID=1290 RepID=UPI00287B5781|nr:ABC transporter permease [Staphylococcus hominis]MDS3879375.1 ABC transporter permease [Staphylococcus hominis]